jgi:hypothetical protein
MQNKIKREEIAQITREDELRDHLERAAIAAELIGSTTIAELAEMALLELNELEGDGAIQAILLREAARGSCGKGST